MIFPFRNRNAYDDVIKWKDFPRYWPFVRGIHRYPMNSPHKGQWRGALMCVFICVWINGWVMWGWWFETLSRPLWRHCNGKGYHEIKSLYNTQKGSLLISKSQKCCTISGYQGQEEVITSHIIGRMYLLVPAVNTCWCFQLQWLH